MKNKNRFGSIILKSFIVIAVFMMLISVMPGEGRKVSETTINYEGIERWSKTN